MHDLNLFKGEQEINSTHTARQGKSRDGERKRDHLQGGINDSDRVPLLICVKSKHGCSSGMIGWTANPLNPFSKDLGGPYR